MCHLDKGRLLRQFFDRDSSVAQDALLAIDESHLAHAGTGITVPVVQSDVTRFVSECGDIDSPLLLRSFNQGKLASLPIQFQFNVCVHKKLVPQITHGRKPYANEIREATAKRAQLRCREHLIFWWHREFCAQSHRKIRFFRPRRRPRNRSFLWTSIAKL